MPAFSHISSNETSKIYCYKNNSFIIKKIFIPSSEIVGRKYESIAKEWLHFLKEEKLTEGINLQNICLGVNNSELYVSFDNYLWKRDFSIFTKIKIIQSFLKSIQEYSSSLQYVYFLSNHSIPNDEHIDFSRGFPLLYDPENV